MLKTASVLIFFLAVFSNRSVGRDYVEYHRENIRAQEYFLNGHVDSSLAVYRRIFREWEKPFARDCVIAVELACQARDTALVKEFIGLSFRRGLNYQAVNLLGVVNTFLSSMGTGFQERVKAIYEEMRGRYVREIDLKARAKVALLAKTDQHYRNLPSAAIAANQIYALDTLYGSASMEIVNALVMHVSKYGFVGEHRVGFMDPKLDLLYAYEYYVSLQPIPALLMLHNRCAYHLLADELLKAVKEGELHPRDYAWIYSWSREDFASDVSPENKVNIAHRRFNTVIKCSKSAQVKNYNLGLGKKLFSSNIAQVNEDRWELGIATLEHERRMYQYEKQHKVKLLFSLDGFLNL
jgi:hypothetical protein